MAPHVKQPVGNGEAPADQGGKPGRTVGRRPLSKARLAQFLDIAETSFLQRGYAETSIDQLSRLGAISKKTIYSYFGNKPGIFQAVVQRLGDRALGEDLVVDESLPFGEALFQLARRLEKVASDPAVIAINRLVATEGRKFPEMGEVLGRSGVGHHYRPIASYLQGCVDRGIIPPIDCDAVTAIILATMSAPLMYGVIYDLPVDPSNEALNHQARTLCDLILPGLERRS